MIDFWLISPVVTLVTVVLEVALLSVPEVRTDKVWECPSLYVQNLLHLSTNCGYFTLARQPSVDWMHSPELMMVGTIFRLRIFPRPLTSSHERPTPPKAVLAISRSDLHPVGLLFTLRQDARLETSPSKTPKPYCPAIPSARHPRRRLFIRSLDDVPTFGVQAHERRDEQPHVEPWNVEE